MQLAAIIAVSLGSLLTGAVLGDLAKKFQKPKPKIPSKVQSKVQQLEGGVCAMCGVQDGAVPQKCGCAFHDKCYAPFSSGSECPVCKA